MITTAERSGLVYDLPAEDYHQPALGVASKSGLDKIARSPAHYRAWLEGPHETTPAMEFGSLFHAYTLETAKTLAEVVVAKSFGDCRVKANKAARDEFLAEHAGKRIIDPETWDTCRRMGDAVHKHPIAARLLAQGKSEVSIYWQDEDGLDCKARIDHWIDSMRISVDLKTTTDASPEAFARSCHAFRYHVQDSFYRDGLAAAAGCQVKAFLFVAVEKEPPYAVAVYELDSMSKDRGRDLYRANLATLKHCLETDDWPAFGQRIVPLTLPAWSFKEIV